MERKSAGPLRETYAQCAVLHDKWREVYRRDARQLRFDERIYGWLFDKLQIRGTWLDVGCGSGERTVMLAARAEAVVAVDLSPDILQAARAKAIDCGLGERIRFERHAIEELPPELHCDHVHCRGVLMHVPDWRAAVANLCRCVSGGYLVLFEANRGSLEAAAVKLLRWVRPRKSRMAAAEGGLEFWSEVDGRPFLVRMADRRALESAMRANGVEPLFSRSVAVLDPLRVPRALRGWTIALNSLWFRANLPFGSGVLMVGKKV